MHCFQPGLEGIQIKMDKENNTENIIIKHTPTATYFLQKGKHRFSKR